MEFGDSDEGSGGEGDAESEGGEDMEPPTHTRHRARRTHSREDGEGFTYFVQGIRTTVDISFMLQSA